MLNPSELYANAQRAIQEGRLQEGLSQLQALVTFTPDWIDAWWLIARSTNNQNDRRNALNQILRLNPRDEAAQRMLYDMGGPSGNIPLSGSNDPFAGMSNPFAEPSDPFGGPDPFQNASPAPRQQPPSQPPLVNLGGGYNQAPQNNPFVQQQQQPFNQQQPVYGQPVYAPVPVQQQRSGLSCCGCSGCSGCLILIAIIPLVIVLMIFAGIAMIGPTAFAELQTAFPDIQTLVASGDFQTALPPLQTAMASGDFDADSIGTAMAPLMTQVGGFEIPDGTCPNSNMVTGGTALDEDNLTAKGSLTVNTSQNSELSGSGRDAWKFRATAGQRVVVYVTSPVSRLDTYLEVYDAEDRLIAQNDDIGGGNRGSCLFLSFPQAGTYSLIVRPYSTGNGSYTIEVRGA